MPHCFYVLYLGINDDDDKILQHSINLFENYKNNMDQELLDKGIRNIFELISIANIYVDKQAPWELKKIDLDRMNTVLSILVELIKRITIMLYPIMPSKSYKILQAINYDIKKLSFDDYINMPNKENYINKIEPFFPRYESL